VRAALRAFQHYCGIHSSRFGFFPREAPFIPLKSVALPTELPGRLSLKL
jgi:hypothetical protein